MLSEGGAVIYMWEHSETKLVAPEVQLGQMCNWTVDGTTQVPSVTVQGRIPGDA